MPIFQSLRSTREAGVAREHGEGGKEQEDDLGPCCPK